jgi:hypothetical protein
VLRERTVRVQIKYALRFPATRADWLGIRSSELVEQQRD